MGKALADEFRIAREIFDPVHVLSTRSFPI